MKMTFLGAAGTVTGSKYLVESGTTRILVDCGLFQGLKALRLQNWEKLPIDVGTVSAVVLTHAHIDHSGYLPKFLQDGFKGKIFCTPATAALCQILLLDSAKLMEEEARYANRRGFSKHNPALPLFTVEDAERAIAQLEPTPFHTEFQVSGDIRAQFGRAGHILGAAHIIVSNSDTRIAFSGDVGRLHDPVMLAPELLDHTKPLHALVIESTYGNRKHPKVDPSQSLADAVHIACERGGSVLIPAFAVGRAQEIIYYLTKLKDEKLIPELPVFLDSPMASNVTSLYEDFRDEHRLSDAECRLISNGVRYVRDVEESKTVQMSTDPKIVISASGMATGGRVLHYMKKMAPCEKDVILFAGFQAAGTRGDAILSGETEIKIHGDYVPVHAKVLEIANLSAHADASEIVEWLESSKIQPQRVFVTHGEPAAADALRLKLTDRFNWRCEVATQGQCVDLGDGKNILQ